MNNQMTTSMQLADGSVPVNLHTTTEKIVIATADGTSLQAMLEDFEDRIAVLEAAAE